ncbi:serine/threonine-protein kinase [Roseimicrobium sp. ORNL1]|uniref:serine/threonine-protein kinase n=1 Tax=Roseimicrobium sp. ORNL1 TaxID=2711231 RepID=UPI0013E1CFAC|nr:serine/threonine-protein kinase [Roseimicrobium sp. ORNL1]QIF00692.1 serine/threonine protein kinase [Roseimicrobium sp. ORNL1]
MSTDSNLCPKCSQPLPPDAPRGLCPACLMAAAMETEPLPASAMPAPEPEMLAKAFPQLEILEPLGAGGMGRVYKVRQPHLDRIAALKILPPELASDAGWVERFHREARALARLNHPHIVQVFDFGEASSVDDRPPLPYLLMELVDGVNLRQAMQAGTLTAREALAIVPKLCEALQYAHERGVLHRDLKPENILMDGEGRVKIADFGLAKFVHGKEDPPPSAMLTQTGMHMGTAAYMAPEQIEHPQDVDHRADIYSLGVVFYEMLTGGLPLGRFPAPSETSGVDPRLDGVVFRTLEKHREKRYQSAGEVKTGLEHVYTAPASPSTDVAPTLLPRNSGCNVLAWILVSVFFCLLAGLAIPMVLYFRAHSHPPVAYQPVATQMCDTLNQVATKVSVDHTVTPNGAFKIEAPHGTILTVAEQKDIIVPPGGKLWCRAMMKSEGTPSSTLTFLEVYKESTLGDRYFSRSTPGKMYGSWEWREVVVPVSISRNETLRKVLVNVSLDGPGTVWIKDIRLSHEPTP